MFRFLLFLLVVSSLSAQPSLQYKQNKTLSYPAVLEAYRYYDHQFNNARLIEVGRTDAGEPLHLFLIANQLGDAELSVPEIAKNKAVLLINNGIHPGESCGIDASLKLVDRLLQEQIPDSVLLAIIPVYNVGGALNRNSHSRANQNGPEEYGFRGNATNLDLNRDFIKADALNTLSFYAIFHALQPHIFVDTHTSNGADYQYTMSLISTQKDKLNPVLAEYMTESIEPYLYRSMDSLGWEMTPYVNVFGTVPDHGFAGFLESPRYASGYTALFNTIGFITEAHMLKPYADRVEATYSFLNLISHFLMQEYKALQSYKARAIEADLARRNFDLNWKLDSSSFTSLSFKGYAYNLTDSELYNGKRLQYLSSQPREIELQYYNDFKAVDSAVVPDFYVLPAAWRQVVLRLQSNNVAMIPMSADTSIKVEEYHIDEVSFADYPYEGHFPIKDLKVHTESRTRSFRKGDWLIPTDQPGRRYLLNTLEPVAVDSYLRWNFFDAIFQQKEYFSAYVFEETAAEMLAAQPALQREFEQWKKDHPEQAANPYAALSYLYYRSPHYESSHRLYPVYRVPEVSR